MGSEERKDHELMHLVEARVSTGNPFSTAISSVAYFTICCSAFRQEVFKDPAHQIGAHVTSAPDLSRCP